MGLVTSLNVFTSTIHQQRTLSFNLHFVRDNIKHMPFYVIFAGVRFGGGVYLIPLLMGWKGHKRVIMTMA